MLNNYSPVVRLRKYAAAAKWIQRERTMEKMAQPGPGVTQYRAYHGPAAANQFKPNTRAAGPLQPSLAGQANNFAQHTRTGTPNQRVSRRYADTSKTLNAGRGSLYDMMENGRDPRLALEEGRMTDRERNMRAWMQQGTYNTRWYQPVDWFRRGLNWWDSPAVYNWVFPMPDNYRAPRD